MPSGTSTVDPATTPASSVVDSSHPYYLHPSYSPGLTIVNSVFDGKGFPGWRRSILIALSAKR